VKAVLVCGGSRGDSEPLAALALELQAAGHQPLLVTWEAEHRRLGFPARSWDDAFPLQVPFPLRLRAVAARLGRRGPVGEAVRRALVRAAAFVPRVLGREEAARVLQLLPARDLLREILLSLPLLGWTLAVLLAHFATLPLALACSRDALAACRTRRPTRWPSLVDVVMLVDAALRREWRDSTPHSLALLDRSLAQLRWLHPVPDRLLEFVDGLLEHADVVVVGEGGDDPVRERLVLLLAALRGVPCVRASFFPRATDDGLARPAWQLPACLPLLLPVLESERGRRFSRSASRPLLAVLELVASACDAWHAALGRALFGERGFLALVGDWRGRGGEAPLAAVHLLAPAYAKTPRFLAVSRALLDDADAAGFWRLPANTQPLAPEVERFLDGSLPVVFVSRVARSSGFQQALAEALPLLPPCRLLVNLPPTEADPALAGRENVLFVGSLPHDVALPRASAAVHHCGAGTTAAVLRAGLPSLGVPTWGDQLLWAERVHALGAGPAPIHSRWLTGRCLAAAIRDCLGKAAYREHAGALGTQLRAEPGPALARQALEKLVASRPSRRAAL